MNNIERLKEIEDLKDGWNGNGAPAFSKELIDKVRHIILSLDHQPEIFPVADNSIQLEFCNEKAYLEIQIFDTKASVYEIDDGKEKELSISNDSDTINHVVNYFMK